MSKNYLKSALLVLTSVLLIATTAFTFTSCKKKNNGTPTLPSNYDIEKDDNVVEDPFGDVEEETTTAKSGKDSKSTDSKSGSSSKKSGKSSSSSSKSGSSSGKSSSSSGKSSGSSNKKSGSSNKNSGGSGSNNNSNPTNKNNNDSSSSAQSKEVTDENGDVWTGYY